MLSSYCAPKPDAGPQALLPVKSRKPLQLGPHALKRGHQALKPDAGLLLPTMCPEVAPVQPLCPEAVALPIPGHMQSHADGAFHQVGVQAEPYHPVQLYHHSPGHLQGRAVGALQQVRE